MYRLYNVNVKKYGWPPQPPENKKKNIQHVVKIKPIGPQV